ncbi:nucleomorphin-like [Acropora millepora]|uniref:nucleomorphin-like n=1 Tax=Acropora millepora TaxID=45264 RepID=UPI001CF51EE2|nr:nucleomorphin-like [Acropora millepora]
MGLERAHSSKSTMTRAMKLHLSIANRGTHNRQIFQNQRRSDTMNQLPQHSYFGQYYFNPQWVQATDSGSPSVVYNNVVNFSVGPDGTHYFHQTYSGQFVAPSASTVDMKMSVAAPSYAEVVKPRAQKASTRSKYINKERREKRQKARQDEKDKTVKEAEEEDEEEDDYEEEEQEYSSDDDVWATEDDEYYDNDSDSSQEECYSSPLQYNIQPRRRRMYPSRREHSPRSPRRDMDARSTIVSLVPKEFQLFD